MILTYYFAIFADYFAAAFDFHYCFAAIAFIAIIFELLYYRLMTLSLLTLQLMPIRCHYVAMPRFARCQPLLLLMADDTVTIPHYFSFRHFHAFITPLIFRYAILHFSRVSPLFDGCFQLYFHAISRSCHEALMPAGC